jgi:CHAT domain-containing protein
MEKNVIYILQDLHFVVKFINGADVQSLNHLFATSVNFEVLIDNRGYVFFIVDDYLIPRRQRKDLEVVSTTQDFCYECHVFMNIRATLTPSGEAREFTFAICPFRLIKDRTTFPILQHLIERYAIVYLPSASLLQFYENRSTDRLDNCAAFAIEEDEDEFMFATEAKVVAELFGSAPIIDAYKNEVFSNRNRSILHFSTHGCYDSADPLLSGIKFKDGLLTAREFLQTKMRTELVALSACETGINERRPGDELIGLTRSILYAGATSVVVSLWPVPDNSTYLLMLEFYKESKKECDMNKGFVSKAAALQKAQLKVMKKELYAHPHYWAAFIIVGDWK